MTTELILITILILGLSFVTIILLSVDIDKHDPVEKGWNERKATLKKITIEFSNGEVRELSDNEADEWWHDLHRVNSGRKVNWKRHKWVMHLPETTKTIH